ncbi:MAG: aldehyde dehydrogenase [Candidatus Marsarchaeota archaeon]
MSKVSETRKQFINGEFVEGEGPTFQNLNPSTEEVISVYSSASVEQVNEAVDAAEEAQKKWATLPAVERAGYVKRVAAEIRKRRQELAEIISREEGKILKEALGEVDGSAEYADYMAEWARRIEGEIVESDRPNENIFLYREPIGVVAGIIPWNYPLFVFMRKFAPALVAGDTVVIKPSSETPDIIYEMAKAIADAGIPKGVANVVFGSGGVVGNALASNKKVGFISFTGSVETGQEIMKVASANVTKVSLELGGKAPAIVMDDADLGKTLDYVVASRILNSGQVCNAAERLYVQEGIADEFVKAIQERFSSLVVGDPFAAGTDMGPLVSASQREKVEGMVERAVKAGAKVLTGGERLKGKGYYYPPTLLTEVSQDSEIMRKEVFGPVLPVKTFKDLDEAIAYANDCDYGLTSSIYTQNLDVAMRAANELKFGETYVNREHWEAIQGFHAGWRRSGIGGDDGKHGFEEFFNTHIVYVQYDAQKK